MDNRLNANVWVFPLNHQSFLPYMLCLWNIRVQCVTVLEVFSKFLVLTHTYAGSTPLFGLFQYSGQFLHRALHNVGPEALPSAYNLTGDTKSYMEIQHLLPSLCVRVCVCRSPLSQPSPPHPTHTHIHISPTQSHSICMEIWAPQLESHKALSSTNSYYLFGLLPHKNPATQTHHIFMVMPYNTAAGYGA